jgi:hypothetical protein
MKRSMWVALCLGWALASSAHAVVLNSCTAGCATDLGIIFDVNYTVPPDGRTYRWDLWTDGSNPTVTINLPSPNEDFALTKVSNGDGTFHEDFSGAGWTWLETINPGHTTIITRSLGANYDHCSGASALGDACAASYNVWGNGVLLTVSTRSPVTVFFSQTAVPEPATWAMMLGGFFGLGAILRRRRAALA